MKAIIVYATRYGTTARVAEMVAEELGRRGVEAFARRLLLYYEWFGHSFTRSRMGEVEGFDFMEKVRGSGARGP